MHYDSGLMARMDRRAGLLATAGYATAVVLLVIMAVLVRGYLARLDALGASVRHTNDVIERLNDATSSLLDLRTAERAFLATGNPAYRAQYDDAARAVSERYREVGELTADNPSQHERAARVLALSQKLLRYTADAVAARAPRDQRRRALRDEERESMRELIALTREMTVEENQLLGERRLQARGALRQTITTVLLALGLALALVIVATWATSTNIARRKRALQEQARLQQLVELQAAREENARLQERFMGILGHDLRNPLSAILMGVTMLQGVLPEGDPRVLARIGSSAERMARMIDQLLDLTRSRHGGGIPVEPRPLELADVVRRVVEELELANPDRTLTVGVEGETWGEWDPDRLAQVVSNLVGNAIRHGDGERPVEVRVRGEGGEVALAVHNHGAPIAGELVPILFDPFHRAKGSSPSGLGLGLFIARQIVLAHGGEIGVASTAEEGTTFTVRLPRRSKALRLAGPENLTLQ